MEMIALPKTNEITPDWVGIVVQQIETKNFGVIQNTVHESRVVPIEQTENARLDIPKRREELGR